MLSLIIKLIHAMQKYDNHMSPSFLNTYKSSIFSVYTMYINCHVKSLT